MGYNGVKSALYSTSIDLFLCFNSVALIWTFKRVSEIHNIFWTHIEWQKKDDLSAYPNSYYTHTTHAVRESTTTLSLNDAWLSFLILKPFPYIEKKY